MSDLNRSCAQVNSEEQSNVIIYLTSRIPKLKTDGAVFKIQCLAQKVYANSRLVSIVKSVIHESDKKV